MKGIIVDVSRCNGCHACQVACKDEHCDQPWLPYAEAQPQTGQFWLRVNEKERGQIPLVKVAYTPSMCCHCQDAPCQKVAPEGVFERREDGLLILKPVPLDPETARAIADACPIGAIFVNEDKSIAQKCTGCAHLLDNGWSEPRCVDVCPTGALRFGEIDELLESFDEAEVLDEKLADAKPLVRYLNLPKRFVGGTVIDSGIDEVVIGANVTISSSSGFSSQAKTDDFGDWLFEQIMPDVYEIKVCDESGRNCQLTVDVTEKDLFAGVLDLA